MKKSEQEPNFENGNDMDSEPEAQNQEEFVEETSDDEEWNNFKFIFKHFINNYNIINF